MNTLIYSVRSLVLAFLFISFSGLTNAQKRAKVSEVMAYYCAPCGSACDLERHNAPGLCKHCGMTLVKRSVVLMDSIRGKQKTSQKRNVAIFIHNGVEVLDFSGPSEVFASTEGFNVYTVSLTKEPIISQGFIKIVPNYSLTDCPKPDIVVLPGGQTGPFLENKPLINWIKASAERAEIMLSVCTGAGLLARAGLLDGKQATTFHNYIDALQKATPNAKILRNTRFVDNGQIITTAGVSAGIDGALHVVAKLKGIDVATQTARYMEYDKWKPNEGLVVEPAGKSSATRN
ncbi:DJ-1/PfpI family protein [Spirosoma endophyticum]|uniref:DJ-1/PfpI family protein n=1 Tax=Spirosoma endophyticum TaxID=662367 RepID=A0A1I2CWF9_9BACT|nr:DJ-1/PfpI family protein [Spirosoma endophyticum]SFE72093.1 DJ-1/PfpI family protein [Spirosoma endophyticum]